MNAYPDSHAVLGVPPTASLEEAIAPLGRYPGLPEDRLPVVHDHRHDLAAHGEEQQTVLLDEALKEVERPIEFLVRRNPGGLLVEVGDPLRGEAFKPGRRFAERRDITLDEPHADVGRARANKAVEGALPELSSHVLIESGVSLAREYVRILADVSQQSPQGNRATVIVDLAPHTYYFGGRVGGSHPIVEGTPQVDVRVRLNDLSDFPEDLAAEQDVLDVVADRLDPCLPLSEALVIRHEAIIAEVSHKVGTTRR